MENYINIDLDLEDIISQFDGLLVIVEKPAVEYLIRRGSVTKSFSWSGARTIRTENTNLFKCKNDHHNSAEQLKERLPFLML